MTIDKLLKQVRHRIERNENLLKQYSDANLSEYGYRDKGYIEGKLSILYEMLDELENLEERE